MSGMTAWGTRGVGVLAVLMAATALAATPALGATGGAGAGAASQVLAAARPGPAQKGTGIVQAVRPHAVLVRQLDGRLVRVPVGPRTVVIVNGVRSSLAAVRPGYVVTFALRARGAAKTVNALDPSARAGAASKPGTVQSASPASVVVTDWNNGTATVSVTDGTRVYLDGARVAIVDIQVGDRLVNAAAKIGRPQPPRVLRFRRPG
jgi:hypothetical protein